MKYQIYNGTDTVMTPVGEMMTPDEWYARYPWGKITKMVISAGPINGSFCSVLEDMIESYEMMGCDFTECTTDEEILAVIEAFDKTQSMPNYTPTAQDRIASAIEAQVVLATPDLTEEELAEQDVASASDDEEETAAPAFDPVASNYERGLWDINMMRLAVRKGKITKKRFFEITGKEYY